jgi:hypothetical protein
MTGAQHYHQRLDDARRTFTRAEAGQQQDGAIGAGDRRSEPGSEPQQQPRPARMPWDPGDS